MRIRGRLLSEVVCQGEAKSANFLCLAPYVDCTWYIRLGEARFGHAPVALIFEIADM